MKYVLLLFVLYSQGEGTNHYHQIGIYISKEQCQAIEKSLYEALIAEGKAGSNLHLSCITEDDAVVLNRSKSFFGSQL